MSTALRSRSRSTVTWLGLAAGLVLTFLLPRSASADCYWILAYYLYNDSASSNLNLVSSSLDWGKWSSEPHRQIGPGTGGSFTAQGRCGTWTGIQGTVEYQIDDGTGDTLHIEFNVPYRGANSGRIWVSGAGSDGYEVEYHGDGPMPSGGHVIVLFPHLKERTGKK
jgi:hypothetical protein